MNIKIKLLFPYTLLIILFIGTIFLFLEKEKLSTSIDDVQRKIDVFSEDEGVDEVDMLENNVPDLAELQNKKKEALTYGMVASYVYYELLDLDYKVDANGKFKKGYNSDLAFELNYSNYKKKISDFYSDSNPQTYQDAFSQKKEIFKILKEVLVNRNSDFALDVFNSHKETFYRFLPLNQYLTFQTDFLVKGLLITYNKVISQEDYRDKLNVIYNELNNSPREAPIRDKFLKELELINNVHDIALNEFISSEEPWLFGFWVRRQKEGNMEQVHSILAEIDSHYSK